MLPCGVSVYLYRRFDVPMFRCIFAICIDVSMFLYLHTVSTYAVCMHVSCMHVCVYAYMSLSASLLPARYPERTRPCVPVRSYPIHLAPRISTLYSLIEFSF